MPDLGYQRGDFVRKKRNPGMAASVVEGPIDDAGDILWKVRLPDGSVRKWEAGTFELVPQKETIADLLRKAQFGRKSDFSQLLTFHRLDQPLTNNIYSLHSNRIDFYPFQFKPLLKFIDSPNQRLLIADDVGLGKTIEAGLILSELKVRSSLQTVLVACPAHLREKWRLEMRRRFSEDFSIVDAAGFRQFLNDYRESSGQMAGRVICSIQSMRSERTREELERIDPRFDLVIVDEAHHMRNSGTQTHALGRMLSRQAEALLFLTATPVQTQLENLFNLLRLLDEEHFQNYYLFERQLAANEHVLSAEAALARVPPDFQAFSAAVKRMSSIPESEGRWFEGNPLWEQVLDAAQAGERRSRRGLVDLRFSLGELNLLSDSLTRTRKVDVRKDVAHREPQVLHVTYSDEERRLYELVLNYVRSRYSARTTFFEKAALMMPQRRAASSIIGASRFYLSGGGQSDIDDYLASLDDGSADLPDELDDDPGDMRVLFERAAAGNMPDTKYDALLGFMQTLQRTEKVILFSTFPSTLEYLQQRLAQDGFRGVIISGKVAVEERPEIVEGFRDDARTRVLLSSEVGGEGLDMQFCSVVVNYDLPWNPMVVAQRIGRVDRIGQRSPVIRIINFSVKDTIDQVILERLYNRIQLFERSIGLTDGILGNVLEHIADTLLSVDLSEAARLEKIEREARAMEAKLIMLEQMDDRSDGIFISDSFLEDEVDRANRLHRYVSDAELETLVTEFLSKFYPRTILARDTDQAMTYRLDPDQKLRSAFAAFRYEPGDQRPAFLYTREPAPVTFSVATAENQSRIEHVNITHPLVRLVVRHYREHGHEFARTAHFSLASTAVPGGYYLAAIHKLVAAGVRPRVMLLSAVVNLDSVHVLDDETSEILVAEMITNGRDVTHLARVPDGLPVDDAYAQAQQALREQDSGLRGTLRTRDAAFRARRVASLRAYYDRRVARQRTLASEHRGRGSSESMVKGFLTRATNLENECDGRIAEIEGGRPFDPETEEVLTAVVQEHE